MKQPVTHHPISFEKGGKTFTGWYYTERGMITVGNINGQKTTRLIGGSAGAPQGLARIMLRELDWAEF